MPISQIYEDLRESLLGAIAYFKGFEDRTIPGLPELFFELMAAVTVLAAAFFGAWFADIRARKAQERQRLLREFHLLASVGEEATAICEAALNLKRQHIKDLCDQYFFDRKRVLKNLELPPVHKEAIEITFDLRNLPEAYFDDISMLQRLSESERSQGLLLQAAALRGSISGLKMAIQMRDEMIKVFHALPQEVVSRMYFGLEVANGVKDERYKDSIEGLALAVDTIIFHSFCLSRRLAQRALSVRGELRDRHNAKNLRLVYADYSADTISALFPNFSDFQDWLHESEEKKTKGKRASRETDKELMGRLSISAQSGGKGT